MPRTMSTISLFSASSFFCSSSLSQACCSEILALTLSISAWIFMLFAVAINISCTFIIKFDIFMYDNYKKV